MANNRLRAHQHLLWLNEYEIRALEEVFTRLGKDLGEFTKAELLDLLAIFYNLPHSDRGDSKKTLAAIRLSGQGLGTVRRYEIDRHAKNAAFRRAALQAVAQVRKELDDISAHLEREDA